MLSIDLTQSDLTLRELVWMSEGYQDAQWNHTASLRALIAPITGFVIGGKELPNPDLFHPLREVKQQKTSVRDMKRDNKTIKRRRGN